MIRLPVPAPLGMHVVSCDALGLRDEGRISYMLKLSPWSVLGDGEYIDTDCFFDSGGKEWQWSTKDVKCVSV